MSEDSKKLVQKSNGKKRGGLLNFFTFLAASGHHSHKWIYICWGDGQIQACNGQTVPPTEIFAVWSEQKGLGKPPN